MLGPLLLQHCELVALGRGVEHVKGGAHDEAMLPRSKQVWRMELCRVSEYIPARVIWQFSPTLPIRVLGMSRQRIFSRKNSPFSVPFL